MKKRKGKMVAALVGIIVLLLLGVYWQDIAAWAKFVYLFESIGRSEQGYLEYRHRQTGIVMVRVPGGTFLMGSEEDETGSQTDERPRHKVMLDAFLIAKYEVTQAEWKRLLGNSPSPLTGDDLPVERVSWDDCQEFCELTSLRLPTEAQWEHACRAETSSPYAGNGRLDDMGWYGENGGKKANPTGKKQPNTFGLYDMHGNVMEWCADVFDSGFYSAPESSTPNPVCTSGSKFHVIRGGFWWEYAGDCRSASRHGIVPDGRNQGQGFRPAYFPLP